MEEQVRSPRRRLARAVLAATLAVGMVAATGGIAFGDLQRVKAVDNKFKPKHKYIEKGDKVRWKNRGNNVHNVKATDQRKNWNYFKTIEPGETASKVFKTLGTYAYRCTLHSSMVNGKCEGSMCGFIHVLSQG